MGLYPALRLFTPEEYLTIERAAETKSEYMDGRIYAMAGSTRGHDAISVNTLTALQMRLRGKGCRAHSGDVRVLLSSGGPYYYPDVSVVCTAEADWESDLVGVATVICEVFSQSTANYDQEVKLKQYRLMRSVREILMISQDTVDIQHHFRGESQMWDARFYSDINASIPLASIGLELPIAEIYEGVRIRTK